MSSHQPTSAEEEAQLKALGLQDDELDNLSNWDQSVKPASNECVSDAHAKIMFWAAVGFVCLLGIALPHTISERTDSLFLSKWLLIPLGLVWIFIVLESLLGMLYARDSLKAICRRFWLVCLIPPFRLGMATAYPNRFVWFPKHGWLPVSKLNFERIELRLALPMLAITLTIIPSFVVEMIFKEGLETHLWIAGICHVLAAFVWIAFVLEFLMMFSLAEKKLVYCRIHWVNIAIIILPLFAVLRTIRLLRFMRMAKAAKIMRAYRLRGIFARGLRLALVFNVIDRVLERNPEKYLGVLEEKLEEKRAEVRTLEERITQVQKKIEAAQTTKKLSDDADVPETSMRYAHDPD